MSAFRGERYVVLEKPDIRKCLLRPKADIGSEVKAKLLRRVYCPLVHLSSPGRQPQNSSGVHNHVPWRGHEPQTVISWDCRSGDFVRRSESCVCSAAAKTKHHSHPLR